LKLQLQKPTDFALKLRHPHWSKAAVVLVNGKEVARSSTPSSYVDVSRTWQNGDEIELQLTMGIAVDSAPAAPDIVAFTYGPLVLAAALGRDGLASGSDIIVNEREIGKYNNSPFTSPVLRGDPDTIAQTIRRGERSNEFLLGTADKKTVRLIPYYRIAHERYATYWQIEPPGA
jgi:DUF1680 family protein